MPGSRTSHPPSRRTAVGLTIAAVVLRWIAVAGFRLSRYVDSAEYDRLDFSGRWRRPWTTPLLFRLSPGDSDAVLILVQATIGALAWSALAFAALTHLRDRRVRIGAGAAILALSLTTTVTSWDTAKLSESLAISLSIALLAAWLLLLHRATGPRIAAVLLIALPWLFVRQSLLPLGVAVTIVAIAFAIRGIRRGHDAERRIVLAAGLLLLTLLAAVSFGRNQEIARTNLTAMISNRIAHDPDHLAWFRANGMPLPPGDATDFGSLANDPAFTRWVTDEAGGTYARFLLTHPRHAATGPVRDLFAERPTFLAEPPFADEIRHESESMLSPRESYGGARAVLPRPIEEFLLDPGHTGSITLVLAGAVAIVAVDGRRRRLGSVLDRAGIVTVVIAALGLWAAWHGSTTELGRLGLVPAIILRAGLILLIAGRLDDHADASA